MGTEQLPARLDKPQTGRVPGTSASIPPPSYQDLIKLANTASLLTKPLAHSTRVWINASDKLLTEGKEDKARGDLAGAYIKLLKGISIALEVLPTHKDFNVNDMHYTSLRRKISPALIEAQELRSLIIDQTAEWERSHGRSQNSPPAQANPLEKERTMPYLASAAPQIPPLTMENSQWQISSPILTSQNSKASPEKDSSNFDQNSSLVYKVPSSYSLSQRSNSESTYSQGADFQDRIITSKQLFELLSTSSKSVLILDVRRKEEYILGHISWKRPHHPNPLAYGGVVNIEPEWLHMQELQAEDIRTFISSFCASSSKPTELFDARNVYDLIVLHDSSSQSMDNSSILSKLYRIIYDFEFSKIPKNRPVILEGGLSGWLTFISSQSLSKADWAEIGEGCGMAELGRVDNAAGLHLQASGAHQHATNEQSGMPRLPTIHPHSLNSAQPTVLPIRSPLAAHSTNPSSATNLHPKDFQRSPISPLPPSQLQQQDSHVICNPYEYIQQRSMSHISTTFPLSADSRNTNRSSPKSPMNSQHKNHTFQTSIPPPISTLYGLSQSPSSKSYTDGHLYARADSRLSSSQGSSHARTHDNSLNLVGMSSDMQPSSAGDHHEPISLKGNPFQSNFDGHSPKGSPPSSFYANQIQSTINSRTAYPSTEITVYPPVEYPSNSSVASRPITKEFDFESEIADFHAAYPELKSPTTDSPAIPPKPSFLASKDEGFNALHDTVHHMGAGGPRSTLAQQISPPMIPSKSKLVHQELTPSPDTSPFLSSSPRIDSASLSQIRHIPSSGPLPTPPLRIPPVLMPKPSSPFMVDYPIAPPRPQRPLAMRRTSSSSPSSSAAIQPMYYPPHILHSHNMSAPTPQYTDLHVPRAAALRHVNRPHISAITNGMDGLQLKMSSTEIGMAGLKNLGNTCFMNSIIQCLSGTTLLTRFFLTGTYRKFINRQNPLGSRGLMVDSYSSLMQSIWRAQESVVVPSEFKSVVSERLPLFAGNDQHDSQEFLSALLDALHEDLNIAQLGLQQTPRVMIMSKGGLLSSHQTNDKEAEQDTEGIPDEVLLEREWKAYRQRNKSIIVDTFQGLLKSCLRCLTCNKTSTTFNPFMYLSLPIPEKNRNGIKGGPVLLDDCLRLFVEEEILDGDNAWLCPRCKTRRRASKRLTIATLPDILLIHFKRFSFDGPFRNKVDTFVYFKPSGLDLTSYVMPKISHFGAPSEPSKSFSYNLFALSNHFGGLSGGHYTAQVKNNPQQKWYNFDDSRISNVEENGIQSEAAYILLYARDNADGDWKRWWCADPSSML
ncbi:hypothetical protein BASA83_002618 [Batrachochytrium salamandrivorans]|nr:hypothetical protein BASA81_008780 [Batrachochytrium salamandrivorans]KAH9274906.1 hypothetical protein BASA83_002618 [Batrachochytrium salamandrivorans]